MAGRRHSRLLMACGVLLLAPGCASQTPQPALIEQLSDGTLTDETLATLNAAASSLLNGRKVRLAKTAFTQHPKLSVGPGRGNTPKGRLALGRTIVLPDELRLLRVGRRCELMHVATEERIPLSGIDCKAISPEE